MLFFYPNILLLFMSASYSSYYIQLSHTELTSPNTIIRQLDRLLFICGANIIRRYSATTTRLLILLGKLNKNKLKNIANNWYIILRMCVQAKWILMAANREMKERGRTPNGSEPSSPNTVPLVSPSSGLSMKRSLQNFLQKRKNRILEASPYHH